MQETERQKKLRKLRRQKQILKKYQEQNEEIARLSESAKQHQKQAHDIAVLFRDAFIEEARRRGDTEYEQQLNDMVAMSEETAVKSAQADKNIESTRYYFDEEEKYLNYQIEKLEAEEEEEGGNDEK